MYDARLGRWFSMDPMAEKYPMHSPYIYCANNPIKYIDPDGCEWEITRDIDGSGFVTFNITLTGVLYNNSSNSNINMSMNHLLQIITSQIESVFNINRKDFAVNINCNLRVATSLDDISITDHVFQIMDEKDMDKDPGGNIVLGTADVRGLNIRLNADALNEIVGGLRTIPHELGHTGGLWDVNKNNYLGVDRSTNLMTQTLYLQDYNIEPRSATSLDRRQIESLYLAYTLGWLNHGSPLYYPNSVTTSKALRK